LKEGNKMSEKNIEVEIRSFLSKEQYEKLLEFFVKNSRLIEEDSQETHYFDCPEDLRIQKNNNGSKIWMKKGKIHDEHREEIEIKMNHEDFNKARKILNSIGLSTEIIWLRKRKKFEWKDIKVCLDHTIGYGYLIELEKMSSEENKEEILNDLKGKFNELQIPPTSKEEFEKRFNHYKENWEELMENAMG